MSKKTGLGAKDWALFFTVAAIYFAGCFVAGILFAVDTEAYGPVDKLYLKGGVPCRQYVVDEHRVSLCANNQIHVEDME